MFGQEKNSAPDTQPTRRRHKENKHSATHEQVDDVLVFTGGVQFTTEQLAVGANECCCGYLSIRFGMAASRRASVPWFRTEALLVITNNALAHANGVEDETDDRELQILRHENKIAHLKFGKQLLGSAYVRYLVT